jgi:hypothetical protein
VITVSVSVRVGIQRALEGKIPDFPVIPLQKRQSQFRWKARAKGGAAGGAGLAAPGSDREIQDESSIRATGRRDAPCITTPEIEFLHKPSFHIIFDFII